MSQSKNQLVEDAFEEIGFAPYNFEIVAEQRQSALRRMDRMVGLWAERGVSLGYALGGKIDDDSGLTDAEAHAVTLNLAVQLAPSLGKTPSEDTRRAASAALDALFKRAAMPREQQFPPTLPRGAGAKSDLNTPFMSSPDTSPLQVQQTDQLDIAKD